MKQALKEFDKLIIAIGSAQESGTKENPFSAADRKKMIELALQGEQGFEIVFIEDIFDDTRWVSHCEQKAGKFDVVICGDGKHKKLFRNAGYKIKELGRIDDISATEVRDRMLKNDNWEELVPEVVVEYVKKKLP